MKPVPGPFSQRSYCDKQVYLRSMVQTSEGGVARHRFFYFCVLMIF
ncbi:hypothetical protein A3N67_07025 [Enterobacter hormaechei subsp. steigerwaltii]|nr:hypothetical protein A3N67_07025 [Enterobacter hormaechei subsp. steigerwaltii]